MKNHYWTSPIAIYLFLGGLGGGIAFLAWVFSSFVMPDADMGNVFAGPLFASILALALGCFSPAMSQGVDPPRNQCSQEGEYSQLSVAVGLPPALLVLR